MQVVDKKKRLYVYDINGLSKSHLVASLYTHMWFPPKET